MSTVTDEIQEISSTILDNKEFFTNNLTVRVKSNTLEENPDVPMYYLLGGIAGGAIFICMLACVLVMFFKRSVSILLWQFRF